MKPIEVKKKDERMIRRRLYPRYMSSTSSSSAAKGYKYKLNALVRISKAKRNFKKGYLPNWTEEIFTVKSRENRNVMESL